MFFDPLWFVFAAPGVLLALWAQMRVKSAYAEASRIPAHAGFTGAQAADAMLRSAGVRGVAIEPVQGFLSDHYEPGRHVLRLSLENYGGRSLAAVGIAAHEAGHALQEATRYGPLGIRSALVPLAGFGSSFAYTALFLGFFLHMAGLIYVGIGLFALTVVFQIINLPVEFDASRRARVALVEGGLVTRDEEQVVAKVLNAAAWTYVAATLTSILMLLYFLMRARRN
jgi:Zn-dependent membrane protease YugP